MSCGNDILAQDLKHRNSHTIPWSRPALKEVVTGCVILHRRSQVTGDGVTLPAVAARHGYREIVDDAGEQNSVAADTVAHACPLSRRTAVDTIARAACAYGAIVSKIQWPYEL